MFRVEEDAQFAGDVMVLGDLNCSDASIPMVKLSDTAGDLGASKVTQQRVFSIPITGNPASATYIFFRCSAATTLKFFKAVCETKPSSGTLTIDLKKSTGGAAFATVLGTTITFTSADTDRVEESGVFSSTSAAAGDFLAVVITAGTGAANVGVFICLEEAAYV